MLGKFKKIKLCDRIGTIGQTLSAQIQKNLADYLRRMGISC